MAVVNNCRARGYADKDIVVDVVMSTSPELPHVDATNFNAYSMLTRSAELYKFFLTKRGVMRVQKGHPEVVLRHVVGPSRPMPNKIVPI
jgi:hypothetical protein